MLNISAHALAAVAPYRALQDVRFYLCGIYVEPHPVSGVILVATDGHTMGVIHDPTGACDAPRILRTTVELVRAANKPQAARLTLEGEQLVISAPVSKRCEVLAAAYVQPGAASIDGSFPDWRRILPDSSRLARGTQATLNADYVARLALTCKAQQIKYPGLQSYGIPGADSVAVIRIPNLPEFFALIMPMRFEAAEPLPAWLDQRAPQASTPQGAANDPDAIARAA